MYLLLRRNVEFEVDVQQNFDNYPSRYDSGLPVALLAFMFVHLDNDFSSSVLFCVFSSMIPSQHLQIRGFSQQLQKFGSQLVTPGHGAFTLNSKVASTFLPTSINLQYASHLETSPISSVVSTSGLGFWKYRCLEICLDHFFHCTTDNYRL